MAKTDPNVIGERGEAIVTLALTTPQATGEPLFRVCHLGAKWPAFDFMVEIVGSPGLVFLLQAKATQSAIKKRSVGIDVDKDRTAQLLSSPVPAYVVAIHEPSKQVFIGMPQTAKRIRSIPLANSLDDATVRSDLCSEVNSFWSKVTPRFVPSTSKFVL